MNDVVAERPLGLEGDSNRLRIEGVNALGSLEKPVMEILWRRGSASVADVYIELRHDFDDDNLTTAEKVGLEKKYTSVLNTMSNLVTKGFLSREQAEGTRRTLHIYTPVISRDDYEQHLVDTVLNALRDNYPVAFMRSQAR